MITLLEARHIEAYQALCDGDFVAGGENRTALDMFGPGTLHADFWIQTGPDGAPTAAIRRSEGRAQISAAPGCDSRELGAFLAAVGGFRDIRCEAELCRAMFPGRKVNTGPAMEYADGFTCADHTGIVEGLPLDELYRLICTGFSVYDKVGQEAWYVRSSHLFRHGLGLVAGIYENGVLVSTGGIYASGARHGVIACLVTDPARRGEGHAARIVRYLCDRVLGQGKVPTLLAAEDSLARYYEGLGFRTWGRWGTITIEEIGS